MAQSFFWYDLETSGIGPRDARIMQFAGQRTDMELNLVGEPVNVLVKLAEDILPDPDAIMQKRGIIYELRRQGVKPGNLIRIAGGSFEH